MSYRANILKGQGTAQQHRLIANWIRKIHRNLPTLAISNLPNSAYKK